MDNYMKTIISGIKTWVKSIKSDWNESDPTAVGYIKNKPFYTGDAKEVTIIPETTLELYEDWGEFSPYIASKDLELGKTYNIVWNGEVYNCEAFDFDDLGAVGNTSIFGGNDTGEPFLIAFSQYYDYGMVVSTNMASPRLTESDFVTFSITGVTEYVKKIDKKYIPDLIGSDGIGSNAEIFNDYVYNSAVGNYSHAEGECTTAEGYASHVEGCSNYAGGYSSHTEGALSYTEADYSHAEGYNTGATGEASHAEGNHTIASGDYGSHAEGWKTTASGSPSHAEGSHATASGHYGSHAEGNYTIASGDYGSHAEGHYTIASSIVQHVQGQYNIEDANNIYAHIVGNGSSTSNRSNAHTLDWQGNGWYAGSLFVGGTSQDDAEEVATKSDLANNNAPKDNLALIDVVNGYTYIVEMRNGNLVSRCGVSHIGIASMPNKTEYAAGEYFDPTGMIVAATCYDGSTFEITNYTYDTNRLAVGMTEIVVSYVEAGIAHTATVSITVGEYDAEAALIDFTYTTNNDGTYTITGWKGTLNGEPSTEMIVPDNGLIKL